MRNCRLFVVAGLMGAALGSSRVAAAADATVAVLGIEASDGAPDAVATALTDALRQRASAEKGMKLVPGKDLVEIKLIFSCPDEAPSCMAEAAKSLGASKMIFGGVKKTAGDSYLVTLRLLDANRRQVEAWVAEQITKNQSTSAGVRAPVQKWFATLTGQGAMGTLRVRGDVPGTSVSLDGQPVGVIGSDDLVLNNVTAGQHELLASKPGMPPARKSVNVIAGGTAEVSFEMAGSSSAATEPPPVANGDGLGSSDVPVGVSDRAEPKTSNRGVMRAATWATAAAALASFGLAIKFGLDVVSVNEDLDPYRRFPCPSGVTSAGGCKKDGTPGYKLSAAELEYVKAMQDEGNRMQTLQYVALGVGAAFAVASGVLFYKGYLASEDGSVALSPNGPRLRLTPLASSKSGGVGARLTF